MSHTYEPIEGRLVPSTLVEYGNSIDPPPTEGDRFRFADGAWTRLAPDEPDEPSDAPDPDLSADDECRRGRVAAARAVERPAPGPADRRPGRRSDRSLAPPPQANLNSPTEATGNRIRGSSSTDSGPSSTTDAVTSGSIRPTWPGVPRRRLKLRGRSRPRDATRHRPRGRPAPAPTCQIRPDSVTTNRRGPRASASIPTWSCSAK